MNQKESLIRICHSCWNEVYESERVADTNKRVFVTSTYRNKRWKPVYGNVTMQLTSRQKHISKISLMTKQRQDLKTVKTWLRTEIPGPMKIWKKSAHLRALFKWLSLLTKYKRGSISQRLIVLLPLVDRGRLDSLLHDLTTGFLSDLVWEEATLLVSNETADTSLGDDSLLARLVPVDSLSSEYRSRTLTQRPLLTTPVKSGLFKDELHDWRLSIGAFSSFDNVWLSFVSSFGGVDGISSQNVTQALFREGRFFLLAVFNSVKQENEIDKNALYLL